MSDDVFRGRTISGDIQHYTEPTEQADPQIFLDALDALLDTPGVEAVRWNQYTPYFNDGEPCVFSVYSAYVKVAGDDEEVGDYGDGFRSTYDMYEYDKHGEPNNYDKWTQVYPVINGADLKDIKVALDKFENVLENGQHFTILGRKFGDPATVTATKDGFSVEFYDHD